MNTPADQVIDDVDAIRTILDTLKKLPTEERAGVLRYVVEKLGVVVAAPAAAGTPLTITTTHTTVPGGGSSNIRTFVESKKPSSDVQFAAAVAYFHAFEAPQKKSEITGADLTEAARQASWERLVKPSKTLHNAAALGYFDKGGERGSFKINTVGENLVAMAMPPTATGAPTSRRRPKKSAKPK